MTKIWRSTKESVSSKEDKKTCQAKTRPRLGIDFEVGRTLTLRPDYIIRGVIVLTILADESPICVSDVIMKFKGEESAATMIKGEAGTSLREIVKSTIFDCSEVIWSGAHECQGGNMQVSEYCPWKELVTGVYHFPFAVKVPPVNFPPSIEGPKGFSIRYTWQPVLKIAGGTFLEGPTLVTPFVPTTFAPPDKEWTYTETLYKHSKKAGARKLVGVEAILPGNVVSPGQELAFTLNITNHYRGRITYAHCSLRKHFEGLLDKDTPHEKHERSLASTEQKCNIPSQKTAALNVVLQIPRKKNHVPPSHTGRHLQVSYTLRCVIQAEVGTVLTTMRCHEIIIPITLASYAHIRMENCVFPTYPSHDEVKDMLPYYFDPLQDFPPEQEILNDDYIEDNQRLITLNGYLCDHLNALYSEYEREPCSPYSGSGSGMYSDYSIGGRNTDSFTLASSVGSRGRVGSSVYTR